MIASGFDTFTVMAISGHSSTRMLERYTHPTEERKTSALDLPWMLDTKRSQRDDADKTTASEITELLRKLVDRNGIEPLTSALRTRRSPS